MSPASSRGRARPASAARSGKKDILPGPGGARGERDPAAAAARPWAARATRESATQRPDAPIRRPTPPRQDPARWQRQPSARRRFPARPGSRTSPSRPRTNRRNPDVAARPVPLRIRLLRRMRITVGITSALVFVLTGTAWGLYHDVTAGLTTTNVITGGSGGAGQNILLVGVDSRTDAQGNPLPEEVLAKLRTGAESVLNSDTIIVLHLPADGSSATAFSIPRDSYVDIPGYRRDKINAAYPATKALTVERLIAEGAPVRTADQEAATAGRSTLIKTVEQLTGLGIDHYAEVNLLGFYDLTEAIGGVEVCLNAAVDDEFSGAHFRAGPQTISGGDALAFVRQRHGLAKGDLARIRRQQVFLAAVADKLLSGGTLTNPAKLSSLVGVAQKSLVIDPGWDLLGFAKQASDLAAGKLDFLTIPTIGNAANERGSVMLVDPRQVRSFVSEQTTRHAEQAAAGVEPRLVTVDVGNGSGTDGVAARVATQLTGAGFTAGTVANADQRATSVVRYAKGEDAAAQAVAAQLGGPKIEQFDGIAPGHVEVLIGSDFSAARAATALTGDSTPEPPVNAGGVPCVD